MFARWLLYCPDCVGHRCFSDVSFKSEVFSSAFTRKPANILITEASGPKAFLGGDCSPCHQIPNMENILPKQKKFTTNHSPSNRLFPKHSPCRPYL